MYFNANCITRAVPICPGAEAVIKPKFAVELVVTFGFAKLARFRRFWESARSSSVWRSRILNRRDKLAFKFRKPGPTILAVLKFPYVPGVGAENAAGLSQETQGADAHPRPVRKCSHQS